MSSVAKDIRSPKGGGAGGSIRLGGRATWSARRARAAARLRRIPLALALLSAVALVHAGAWTVATAPLNGPDEVSHYAYVQYFAETGKAPKSTTGTGSQSTELSLLAYEVNLLPILGHLEARPTWDAADDAERRAGELGSEARSNGSGANAAAANPPLYYVLGAVAYRLSPDRSALGKLYAVRAATALLLPATVILTWLLASLVFTAGWPRVLATGVVALHPKLGSLAGIVNPDMFLAFLGTAFLYTGALILVRGPTLGRFAWFAAVTVASVLTHGRALYVVPVAGLVLLLALYRARPAMREALKWGAVLVGATFLAGVFAYLWTRGQTGGPAYGGATPAASEFNPRQFLSYLWQFYFERLGFMEPKVGPDYGFRQVYIETFFSALASLEIYYPQRVLWLLQPAAVIGIVATYTALVARWRSVRPHWPLLAFLVASLGALLFVVHAVSYGSLNGGVDPIITGRYLMPCIALYGIAMAFVARSIPRVAGLPLAGFLLAVHVLLAFGGLGLTAIRFYV